MELEAMELQEHVQTPVTLAFREGERSRQVGLGLDANPYGANRRVQPDPEAADWDAGWHAADDSVLMDLAYEAARQQPDFDPEDWQ